MDASLAKDQPTFELFPLLVGLVLIVLSVQASATLSGPLGGFAATLDRPGVTWSGPRRGGDDMATQVQLIAVPPVRFKCAFFVASWALGQCSPGVSYFG